MINQQRWHVNLGQTDPTMARMEAIIQALQEQVRLTSQVLAKTRSRLVEESKVRLELEKTTLRLEKELLESKTTIEDLKTIQLGVFTPPTTPRLPSPSHTDSTPPATYPLILDSPSPSSTEARKVDSQLSAYPSDFVPITRDFSHLKAYPESLPYSEWINQGYGPVLVDAMFGNLDSLMFHVSFDPLSLNQQSKRGETAAMLAAEFGRLNCLEWLVSKGQRTREKNVEGFSPLILSTINGHAQVVDWLLEYGSKSQDESYGDERAMVVHIAAQYGHLEILSIVQRHYPAALQGTNARGEYPIHVAVRCGQMKVVQWIVNNGGSLKVKDQNGLTPLLTAVMQGQLDAVKWLISMGSSLEDEKDADGSTPFLLACFLGNLEMIQWMAQRDTNMRDIHAKLSQEAENISTGEGELSEMTKKRHADGELLLLSSPIFEACNNDGNTPLMVAAVNGSAEVVEWLLSKGAKVRRRNVAGNNAFHLSCYGGHIKTMELLWTAIDEELKQLQETDDSSVTELTNSIDLSMSSGPLVTNAHSPRDTTYHVLSDSSSSLPSHSTSLQEGEINSSHLNGSTASTLALASPSSQEIQGSNAINTTATTEILEPSHVVSALPPFFLDDHNPMVSSLPPPPPPDDDYPYEDEISAVFGAESSGERKLEGDSFNSPVVPASLPWAPSGSSTSLSSSNDYASPLSPSTGEYPKDQSNAESKLSRSSEDPSAIKKQPPSKKPTASSPVNKIKKLKRLMLDPLAMSRAKRIALEPNDKGETPLLIACLSGHLEAVKWLLARGSSKRKEVDLGGMNAVRSAAIGGHVEIIQFLLTTSSKSPNSLLNDANADGYTPLLLASFAGKEKMVRYLLSIGASPRKTNSLGSGPLSLAAINGHLHILQLLVEHGTTVQERHHATSCAIRQGKREIALFLRDRAYSLIHKPSNIKVR